MMQQLPQSPVLSLSALGLPTRLQPHSWPLLRPVPCRSS